jgi:hypothetical protein
MRYTEYHNGVAVIRDKSKLKEAMQKLASYEDVEDYSDMEKITTEFAEYICDKLCKYPCVCDQEELDEYCAECKMAEFICGICNCYNKLNTFVGSQLEKIMIENNRLKNELQDYEDLEEQGLLLKLPCKVGDTAYYLHKTYLANADKWIYEIDEVEVDSFILNIGLLVNVSYRIGEDVFRKTLTPYKTLFFTKAEAEKKLAEMEK